MELAVFSSSFGGYGSYVYPVLLQVNDSKPQPLKVGPGLKVILERKILKPGINALRFFGSTGNTMIDVYELKIELAEAPPPKAPAAATACSATI